MGVPNNPVWIEWMQEFEDGPLRVRAGFRRPDTEVVAGGPLELQFVVEASQPMVVAVAGDRVRVRPDFFRFSATLDSVEIGDPFPPSTAWLGGPGGVVPVRPGAPWTQWLIVNQYLRLERAVEVLAPGSIGRLQLRAGRPIPLTTKDAEAYRREGVPQVEVSGTIPVKRDDARLAAIVKELVDNIRHGPREQRERPLSLVLTLRAPASVEVWKSLVDHPDPTVGERVRQALVLATPIP
jgi:hypothetical protein